MFYNNGYNSGWSTLKKLIYLRGNPGMGSQWGSETLSLTAFAAPTLKTVTKKSKVTSCEVSFTPSQDLHGYDSPWPAGGGKNLFNGDNYVSDTLVPIHLAQGTEITASVSDTSNVVQVYYYDANKTYLDYWTLVYDSSVNRKAKSFTINNADCEYMKFVGDGIQDVQVELGSSATSYAPYESLCPISGWQGADVYIEPTYDPTAIPKASVAFGVQSANQWDEEWELGLYDPNTGLPVISTNSIRGKNPIDVNAGQEYYIVSPENVRLLYYNSNDGFVDSPAALKNESITIPQGVSKIRLFVATQYGDTYLHNIAINYPSTVTTYNPYRDYILGGTAEIVAGTGSEAYAEVDMGDLIWTKEQNNEQTYYFFRATPSTEKAQNTNFICESYKAVDKNRNQLDNGEIGVQNKNTSGYKQFAVRNDLYADSTGEQFATAMAGVKIVYEVATPTQYTFPPASEQLLLQKGDNYNWAEMTNDGQSQAISSAPSLGNALQMAPNLTDDLHLTPAMNDLNGAAIDSPVALNGGVVVGDVQTPPSETTYAETDEPVQPEVDQPDQPEETEE